MQQSGRKCGGAENGLVHLFGVFADATWRRPIDDSVLERVDVDVPDAEEDVKSVGRRPAGRKFRRQIDAG
jgi:hypothetical protein